MPHMERSAWRHCRSTTTKRGTDADDSHAFVVEDGNYVSARWPGDAYLFAKRFEALLAIDPALRHA